MTECSVLPERCVLRVSVLRTTTSTPSIRSAYGESRLAVGVPASLADTFPHPTQLVSPWLFALALGDSILASHARAGLALPQHPKTVRSASRVSFDGPSNFNFCPSRVILLSPTEDVFTLGHPQIPSVQFGRARPSRKSVSSQKKRARPGTRMDQKWSEVVE